MARIRTCFGIKYLIKVLAKHAHATVRFQIFQQMISIITHFDFDVSE